MSEHIESYHRFYSLLSKLPYDGEKEDLKRLLVSQVTNGRTISLREITQKEYNSLCAMMERVCPNNGREQYEARRRKSRSICLRLLQKIGVDTTSWRAVNGYCKSPKIAGTEFRNLSIDDLDRLSLKLRMILKKKEEG